MSDLPAAPDSRPVRVEPLTELEQFSQCLALQEAVWGYDPADMVPRRMFLLASRIGGQVLGAYVDTPAGAIMAGFAMALPGYRKSRVYLHSHMLAVLPEHRNRGIGYALKIAQREDALARGIELMEWTFDPLEIKNAHLNIAKLGAITRRYRRDVYGPSSSPLQGGLPTDRVYAEWWLRSDRVERLLNPQAGNLDRAEPEVVQQVDVPAEIYQWKIAPECRDKARALQARNAVKLESAFASGLAVVGYQRDEHGDGRFLLGRWDEGHLR